VVAIPVALLAFWLAVGSIARAWRLRTAPRRAAAMPVIVQGASEATPERLPDRLSADRLP